MRGSMGSTRRNSSYWNMWAVRYFVTTDTTRDSKSIEMLFLLQNNTNKNNDNNRIIGIININGLVLETFKECYHSCCSISVNDGLSSGSYCQQWFIMLNKDGGQSGGSGSLSPLSSLPMTSSFLMLMNGFTPLINISQQQTPNIHTSLEPVNLLKLMLSGAIHLIGSLPLDAIER